MFRKANSAEARKITRNDLLIQCFLTLRLIPKAINSFLIGIITHVYRKRHTLSMYRVDFYKVNTPM